MPYITKIYSRIKKFKILIILLVWDILFVFLHFKLGGEYRLFDLDVESNLPTTYQGLKLLTFGYFFTFKEHLDKSSKIFWLSISAILVYLGIDELAMIHENVPTNLNQIFPFLEDWVLSIASYANYSGSVWVIYYMPIFILMIPVFLLQIRYIFQYMESNIFIIIAPLLLLSVPILETFNTVAGIPSYNYNIYMAIEEGVEMLAITFFVYGCLSFYKARKSLLRKTS